MKMRGLGCCIVAGLLVGWTGCNTPPKRDLALLQAGEEAYRSRDYARAAARLSEFLATSDAGPDATRALYLRGMARALSGERALGYVDLQAASARAGSDDLAWRAAAALGVLYFEDENWSAAVGYLSNAVRLMPRESKRDAYLFRLGLSLERMGRWQDSETAFGEIFRDYPGGPYAERAERRLRLKPRQFAVQAGVFSRPENAEARIRELAAHGYPARTIREARRDGDVLIVLVGGYATYREAVHALARVRGVVADATLWP